MSAKRSFDWMRAEIAAGSFEYGTGELAVQDMKAALDESTLLAAALAQARQRIARLESDLIRTEGELEARIRAGGA